MLRRNGPVVKSVESVHHLQATVQPRRHHEHLRKIRQKTRFCARLCLLGVAKPKFNIYTTFSPPNRHFGARFGRYLEIISQKPALTLEVLRAKTKRPLNVIVAP